MIPLGRTEQHATVFNDLAISSIAGARPAVYRPSQRPSFRLRMLPSPSALRFAIAYRLLFSGLAEQPVILGSAIRKFRVHSAEKQREKGSIFKPFHDTPHCRTPHIGTSPAFR